MVTQASEQLLQQHLCSAGRRLYDRQLVAANDGNMSIRLNHREILTTPTGVSKGFMSPESMVVVDLDGHLLRGHTKPSSEILMHLAIYRVRQDVGAIVHAHPPYATAFAVTGNSPDPKILAEVVVTLGIIPLAEFRLPSTRELADTVQHYIINHDVVLMANHGAVTVGKDLEAALFRMETLEHFCRIYWIARMMGTPQPLPASHVSQLEQMRRQYGLSNSPGSQTTSDVNHLDAIIRRAVQHVLATHTSTTGQK